MTQDQALQWLESTMRASILNLLANNEPLTKEQMESEFKLSAPKFMPLTGKVVEYDYDRESRMMNTTIQIG